jgi:hypothetical protein
LTDSSKSLLFVLTVFNAKQWSGRGLCVIKMQKYLYPRLVASQKKGILCQCFTNTTSTSQQCLVHALSLDSLIEGKDIFISTPIYPTRQKNSHTNKHTDRQTKKHTHARARTKHTHARTTHTHTHTHTHIRARLCSDTLLRQF